MIEQTYKLSMIPFEEQVRRNYEIPIVPASQYDKTLRTLSFELYNGEDRFTIPAEAVVYIFGMKPDGNAFQYQMNVEDNMAKIAMQTQMTTVAGCVTCEIVLFEENTAGPRIGSANFKLMVEKCAVGDDAEFSRSDMPVIQTLIFGGMVGDVLVKDANGVKWNSESLSTGYMRYDQYDPERTGTVDSARQANNAATVDGHTVARNVLAGEYTNEEIDAALNAKQDKEEGKGLSTEDFTSAEKTKLAGLPTDADLTAELAGKVDKETGKGLSTNDFTDAEKTKLQGIQEGAQVNTVTGVKGDSETTYRTGNINITKNNIGLGDVDNTADLDKPVSTAVRTALDGKVDKETGKGLSSNDFTTEEKNKLAGIEAGAEVNVQANWNEVDQTADSFIHNKPSIPSKTSDLTNDSGFVTDAAMQSALDQKVDKVAGKGLSTEDFTSAEKTKLAGIEAGAQVNTITGVKGDAETDYRTGNVNITKANIGLGNVDNTSDMGKPISTATQTALDGKQATLTFDTTPTAGSTNPVTSDGIATEISALNSNLNQKVSSVNGETPDTNGNVALNAEDILADGVGSKDENGNPIIVTDAVAENAQNLSVDLEPIQDLHGYDHPWAGGAGKNLLSMTVDGIKAENTGGTWNGNVYTSAGCTYEILTDDASNVIGIKVNGTSTANATFWLAMIDYVANTNMSINSGVQTGSGEVFFRISGWGKYTYAVSASSSGNDKSFSFGTDGELWGNIRIGEGKQVTNMIFRPYLFLDSNPMTSFEPYSNICPITGRTQVDVTRTGKNLCPMMRNATDRGVTVTVGDDGVVTANGTNTRGTAGVVGQSEFVLLKAGSYILSGSAAENTGVTAQAIKNVDGAVTALTSDSTGEGSEFTLKEDTLIAVRGYISADANVSNLKLYPMIRLASVSDATYEPYNGQTVTVQLGQTVYGGTLDVTSGVLTVDRKGVDMGTLRWEKNSTNRGVFQVFIASKETGLDNMVCSNYRTVNSSSVGLIPNGAIRGHTTNRAVYIHDDTYASIWDSGDVADFKTAMNGVQLVYELAAPQTIQLTPAQLALLEGYNILTTDGDTLNLRYTGTVASNVQSEIDEFEESTRTLAGSLAMIETSPATANHAVGSYLMLNNRLCKVTSAIATGEQIIVGSNVQYTTIAEELAAILAQINA